ncbi:MAG: DUF2189 domain-containing protein [Hylemonella sp.]|nr:DUF2189 domain-containing protein [Hylemonella sp.]
MTRISKPEIRHIGITQPVHWLLLGWRDMAQCGWISLIHGLLLSTSGLILLAVAHDQFWWLAGAFSGFLMVAPILAVGLYCMSRSVEHGRKPDWRLVLNTWLSWRQHGNGADGKDWRLVQFGLLLGLAGTGWVMTSAALITLFTPVPVEKPMDFLQLVVLSRDSWLFEIWLAIGGMMAAPIFASSAVAIPLLLDRKIGLLQAVVTSWEATLENPLPMACWAGLIMGLTLLGLVTALLGLIAIMPVLGHASWHAYKDLVDASAWPERTSPQAGEQ